MAIIIFSLILDRLKEKELVGKGAGSIGGSKYAIFTTIREDFPRKSVKFSEKAMPKKKTVPLKEE